MSIDTIISIVSIFVSVCSIGYAIYENRTKAKLERYLRGQAWFLYAKANNLSGCIQKNVSVYRDQTNQNPEMIDLFARSDAYGQELFKETVRQIQLIEPKFDNAMIEHWVQENKIHPEHKVLFTQLTSSDSKYTSKLL